MFCGRKAGYGSIICNVFLERMYQRLIYRFQNTGHIFWQRRLHFLQNVKANFLFPVPQTLNHHTSRIIGIAVLTFHWMNVWGRLNINTVNWFVGTGFNTKNTLIFEGFHVCVKLPCRDNSNLYLLRLASFWKIVSM